MEIVVQEVQAKVPVTIMQLQGELDASNYLQVIGPGQRTLRGRQPATFAGFE